MSRLLVIKTSSLGDVVHCLPAVTDMRAALPAATIDWVVEESFAAIPRLHPGVNRVIVCALRRWRRAPLAAGTRSEWRAFRASIDAERYDAVIDAQGLFKSAFLARLARGPRLGLDLASAREPVGLFYDRTFGVPRALHAVERNRRLCAQALGYAPAGDPDCGIRVPAGAAEGSTHAPYAVLLHATSHPRKLWPEDEWIALGRRLEARGYVSVLLWGSDAEHRRAERLAAGIPGARVAPKLALEDAAAVIGRARAVIGVDTGLAHLAAALGVPTVGIYGATDPAKTGLRAAGGTVNLGGPGGFPRVAEVESALARLGVTT